jgi:hypothetical protein
MSTLSARAIIHVPPLAAILLNRVNSRDGICDELLRMRNEFAALREEENRLLTHLANDELSLKERVASMDDYEEVRAVLLEKLAGKRKRARVLYRMWDIVKNFDPVRISTAALDALIANEKGFRLRHRVQPYLRLSQQTAAIRGYGTMLRRVFGSEPSVNSWREFARLQKAVAPGTEDA